MVQIPKHTDTKRYQIIKEDSKIISKEQWIYKIVKKINEMAIVSPYLSIIIFNINGLNSAIKIYRMAE